MKLQCLRYLLFVISMSAAAQEQRPGGFRELPITITVFSESIGMPGFKNLLRARNLGLRVGTELYYRNGPGRQVLQTVNLSYYHHKDFQRALVLSSEFGYRKFLGSTFVDGTIGLGVMVANSSLPRYQRIGDDYQRASSLHHKLVPALGLGAGHRFNNFSLFGRYELFGEMPFGFKGIPALPHQAFHVGTRIHVK